MVLQVLHIRSNELFGQNPPILGYSATHSTRGQGWPYFLGKMGAFKWLLSQLLTRSVGGKYKAVTNHFWKGSFNAPTPNNTNYEEHITPNYHVVAFFWSPQTFGQFGYRCHSPTSEGEILVFPPAVLSFWPTTCPQKVGFPHWNCGMSG